MIGAGIGPVEIAVRAKPAASATHTITVSSSDGQGLDDGCFWSPASPVVVNYRANQNIEVTAIEQLGWSIESLFVDGVRVQAANGMPYYIQTFSVVVANHTIVVTFANGI